MVPKIWATIPLVAGTGESHKKPKRAPKMKEVNELGCENKKKQKEKTHKK